MENDETKSQKAAKDERKICLLPLEVLLRFAICFPQKSKQGNRDYFEDFNCVQLGTLREINHMWIKKILKIL